MGRECGGDGCWVEEGIEDAGYTRIRVSTLGICEVVDVWRDVHYSRLSVEEERAGKWGHNRCHLGGVV